MGFIDRLDIRKFISLMNWHSVSYPLILVLFANCLFYTFLESTVNMSVINSVNRVVANLGTLGVHRISIVVQRSL